MEDEKNNDPQDTSTSTSTSPVDTGTEDATDVQVPLEGFGEIDGDCGLLLDDPINSTAFIVQNSIDFANLTLSEEDLSTGSQEILNDGNLNNGSLYSEIFAFETVLGKQFGKK